MGDAPCVAISPDGQRFVYTAMHEDEQRLYLRELDDFEARTLKGTEGGRSPTFSPDGRWIAFSSRGWLRKVPVDGGSPVEIAPSDWNGVTWVSSEEIVLTPSYASGLSIVSASGGPLRQLTEPNSDRGELGHWWPQSLPNGEWVLFTVWSTPFDSVAIRALSLRTGEQREVLRGGSFGRYVPTGHLIYVRGGKLMARRFDLGRLAVEGSAIPVLDDVPMDPNDGNSQFDVSPDGTLVYLSGSELLTPRNLVWVAEDGTQRAFAADSRQYSAPRLSPSGDRLAVTIEEEGNSDVWILDRQRATWSRMTFRSAGDFNPHWTPEGRYLYYNVEQPQFDIYRRRADLSAEPEAVLVSTLDKLVTSISPDGRWLLYSEANPETDEDIWIMPLGEEAAPREYLKTDFEEQKATFSRDGRWVAYVSNETGRREVYVRSFLDPGRPWQISSEGGDEPLWSRDGRHLYYHGGEGFHRVRVSTSGSFEAGRPEKLFDPSHRGYWASTGYEQSLDTAELLVVQIPRESLPRSVRVVTGWLEELQRLVPR
jgi:serine/threonine-protein kinase